MYILNYPDQHALENKKGKSLTHSLILTLLKKDCRFINDHDLDQFNINLSIAVDEFKKVEVHTKISKRKFNISSMSFVFGGANKKEPISYDFKLSTKEKKEAKKIAEDIKLTVTPTDDKRSYHISSDKIKKKLKFNTKFTIDDAVNDMKKAFQEKKLEDPLNNPNYFNIKKMQLIQLI